MLNVFYQVCTYFCPNSIKIKNKAASTKKVTKEKSLNLYLAYLSEVKNLSFAVSLC